MGQFNITVHDERLPFVVLDTDYINYSIVYSCADLDYDDVLEYMWVMTRSNTPEKDGLKSDEIKNKIKQMGFPDSLQKNLKTINHDDDCKYRKSCDFNLALAGK